MIVTDNLPELDLVIRNMVGGLAKEIFIKFSSPIEDASGYVLSSRGSGNRSDSSKARVRRRVLSAGLGKAWIKEESVCRPHVGRVVNDRN